ncbi:uncharacterized protein LOC101857089 [Aplysia californica]|uniref:Uncharacterized protein LOC101857089 n=1 Tax=Aplysia californica TaxID=6500 RepID=A0ABM0JE36_APLCA|nr:uncharacterized protein LOC101857089 [Aplysia californica]
MKSIILSSFVAALIAIFLINSGVESRPSGSHSQPPTKKGGRHSPWFGLLKAGRKVRRATSSSSSSSSSLPGSIRATRDISQSGCELPATLPAFISDLQSYLNESLILKSAINPSEHVLPLRDDRSEMTCKSSKTHPDRNTNDNLRATCPWVLREKDFGEDAFPRYILEARCLCRCCQHASSMGCQEVRRPVTIYRRVACQDGLAVMKKSEEKFTALCICASSRTA